MEVAKRKWQSCVKIQLVNPYTQTGDQRRSISRPIPVGRLTRFRNVINSLQYTQSEERTSVVLSAVRSKRAIIASRLPEVSEKEIM